MEELWKHLYLLLLLSAIGINASSNWLTPAYKDKDYFAQENNEKRIAEKQSFALSTCALLVGAASCYHMGEYGQNKYNMSTYACSFVAMAKPESAIALYGKIKEKVYNCGSYLKTQIAKASCCSSRPNRKR